eukprot:CAMPEP_0115843052 /NCGR_PEP_ID=MMETSP0287-20121206/8116_1 /TAXON_ID=412157 /ORGANISM="Chrysochromulina rotalis, Strain UIO044" /LENGTH=235 /DNA_ID=CAMNT_0003296739 /DNA_START=52 /DNA_END=760 /DNA_ORIENTATION=-
MAWLLSQAPVQVHTMQGGYKHFRHWAIDAWEKERPLVVVGGPTGSGKTDVLHALRDHLDAQMLDLEGVANHRGSIFGALGRDPQPTNEQYENLLALQWHQFSSSKPVYIEDESHAVGKCGVPPGLWKRMRSEEARVAKLVAEYGVYPPSDISDCVRGLYKRLGHEKVAELTALLEERDPPELAVVANELLVNYYDAMYAHQAKNREGAKQHIVHCDSGDALANAKRLVEAYAQLG